MATSTITPVIANGNAYMASAQRRKAERFFGILNTAGIETEADFALVDDQMWRMVSKIAGKEFPSYTVRQMVTALYKDR